MCRRIKVGSITDWIELEVGKVRTANFEKIRVYISGGFGGQIYWFTILTDFHRWFPMLLRADDTRGEEPFTAVGADFSNLLGNRRRQISIYLDTFFFKIKSSMFFS